MLLLLESFAVRQWHAELHCPPSNVFHFSCCRSRLLDVETLICRDISVLDTHITLKFQCILLYIFEIWWWIRRLQSSGMSHSVVFGGTNVPEESTASILGFYLPQKWMQQVWSVGNHILGNTGSHPRRPQLRVFWFLHISQIVLYRCLCCKQSSAIFHIWNADVFLWVQKFSNHSVHYYKYPSKFQV
jgi:hypothetical protein